MSWLWGKVVGATPKPEELVEASKATPGAANMDYAAFAQGQRISVLGDMLVRADIRERIQAVSKSSDLVMVSKDGRGHRLVAPGGDCSKEGALLLNGANQAIGFFMPDAAWQRLPWAQRPTTALELDGQIFIRFDQNLLQRVKSLQGNTRRLRTIADYKGFLLMADGNNLSKGLLMVDRDFVPQGFWLPKSQYDSMGYQHR